MTTAIPVWLLFLVCSKQCLKCSPDVFSNFWGGRTSLALARTTNRVHILIFHKIIVAVIG